MNNAPKIIITFLKFYSSEIFYYCGPKKGKDITFFNMLIRKKTINDFGEESLVLITKIHMRSYRSIDFEHYNITLVNNIKVNSGKLTNVDQCRPYDFDKKILITQYGENNRRYDYRDFFYYGVKRRYSAISHLYIIILKQKS